MEIEGIDSMNELEQKLWNLVEELKAENTALLEIVLRQQHLLVEETPIHMSNSENKGIGKVPWYIRKNKLELLFKKPAESSKEEEEQDAS